MTIKGLYNIFRPSVNCTMKITKYTEYYLQEIYLQTTGNRVFKNTSLREKKLSKLQTYTRKNFLLSF